MNQSKFLVCWYIIFSFSTVVLFCSSLSSTTFVSSVHWICINNTDPFILPPPLPCFLNQLLSLMPKISVNDLFFLGFVRSYAILRFLCYLGILKIKNGVADLSKTKNINVRVILAYCTLTSSKLRECAVSSIIISHVNRMVQFHHFILQYT